MRSQLRPALVALGIFTILTGLIYPLVVTGLAQLLFHHKANGQLISKSGRVVGMLSIGDLVKDVIQEQTEHIEQLERYIAG